MPLAWKFCGHWPLSLWAASSAPLCSLCSYFRQFARTSTTAENRIRSSSNIMRAKQWTIAAALLAAGLLLSVEASLGEEDEGIADDSVRVEDTPGTGAKTLVF